MSHADHAFSSVCPFCRAATDAYFLGKALNTISVAHTRGQHAKLPVVSCQPCRYRIEAALSAMLGSLADYFAPRPVGWVPRGFTEVD